MNLSKQELQKEEAYLSSSLKEISSQLDILGKKINIKESSITEFRRLLWEEKGSIDSVEMRTSLMSSSLDAMFVLNDMRYYKKLFKIKYSPYFGRIDFKEDGSDYTQKIYIGLTYLEKDLNYIIYDWRSPIASMFYNDSIGLSSYEAPDGIIKGNIYIKRQYKIEDGKLLRVFDNSLNVNDEILQDVLSSSSSSKMKNIVNTIQKEQNDIIRNIRDKNLIVQGIAGSGKTSVALHRIAFLLYKIKNLQSSNVLIFSPNNVFSNYISNVLPELGEDNTLDTTFHDFTKSFIKKVKSVESFSDFIKKYYTLNIKDKLTEFKLSDKMIDVIDNYVKELENNIKVLNDIELRFDSIDSKYINYLLKERYNKLPLFERIDKMAEHLCDKYNLQIGKNKRSLIKKIKDSLNIKDDYIKIYENLFLSNSFKKVYGNSIIYKVNKNVISYDDSICYTYLKGLLQGFSYSNLIKEVVIDEAQDYNLMQYLILIKIFKNASFTILGDVNQTINPYYKYDSLSTIKNIFSSSNYLKLTKTYRSSSEIIEYTNKILNLNYVSAIRKPNNINVVEKIKEDEIAQDLLYLKNKYKTVALITKTEEEAKAMYERLHDKLESISLMISGLEKYNKNFVIIPSYLSKGLEFDAVISYNKKDNLYTKEERYLYYVVLTRCQHELIIYNPSKF